MSDPMVAALTADGVLPATVRDGTSRDDGACGRVDDGARARGLGSLDVVVCVAVALVTFVALSPALQNGFVEWDDPVLITGNDAYRGLGWAQVRWMFSSTLMGHWVPLTWLTLGLDYVVWGMRPAGYHLTNLVFHAVNAGLFFLVAGRVLGAAVSLSSATRRVAAAASALFFALHPLRAESVAWVTERRDVLSGCFFLVTLLVYLVAAQDTIDHPRRYWTLQALAWGTYLLAILSKSIVMTLPAVLIVLDFYPLRRLGADWRAWSRPPAWHVWREKIAYLALGALAAMLGYYGQAVNRYLTSLDKVHWTDRPALVMYSLWFYVSKTFVPVGLGPLYELPATVHPFSWTFMGPALGVLAVTLVVLVVRRRWPAGLAIWLAYAVMVAPVSGAMHAGHQLAHDRYSYLSCLGWALLVGAGVGAFARIVGRGGVSLLVARAGASVILVAFMGLAVLGSYQVTTWRDNETLWRTAVDAQPDCAICEHNLGVHLFKQNLFEPAREHYERALALRPEPSNVRYNLALALVKLDDLPDATIELERVLRDRPDRADALMNLGVAFMKLGRASEGLAHLRRAMLLKPDDDLIRANLGVALIDTGDPRAAVGILRRAIALNPGSVEARRALARAYLALGDGAAARRMHEDLAGLNVSATGVVAPPLVIQ
jgi:protein O-mannosyl-transferase